jgi:hypothetical protein
MYGSLIQKWNSESKIHPGHLNIEVNFGVPIIRCTLRQNSLTAPMR